MYVQTKSHEDDLSLKLLHKPHCCFKLAYYN